jgi:phosphonate transport system substrate-binding protein
MASTRGRFILACGGGGLFVAVSVVLAARTSMLEQPVHVDLSTPTIPTGDAAQQQIRLALAAAWSAERTFNQFLDFGDYLAGELKQPVRLVQRKTYGELVELLRLGGVDVAILCTGAYLAARATGIPLQAIAVPVRSDGPVYRSLFLVRADSRITEFEQLRGHSFGFTDPLSLSGYYYPQSVVAKQESHHDQFFRSVLFTYSDDGSIRAVVDKIVDAAAVDGQVFAGQLRKQPELARQLRVIHRSPRLGISPVVVPESFNPRLRKTLQDKLLGMHANKSGRAILVHLGVLRFEEPPQGLYDYAQAVLNQAQAFKEHAER